MTNPANPWLPISTAPRDGTVVELTDSPDGEVWPMRYEIFKHPAGGQRGVWAMWGFSGSLLSTWSEDDPDFPPRLWRVRQGQDVKVAA